MHDITTQTQTQQNRVFYISKKRNFSFLLIFGLIDKYKIKNVFIICCIVVMIMMLKSILVLCIHACLLILSRSEVSHSVKNFFGRRNRYFRHLATTLVTSACLLTNQVLPTLADPLTWWICKLRSRRNSTTMAGNDGDYKQERPVPSNCRCPRRYYISKFRWQGIIWNYSKVNPFLQVL